MSTQAPGPDGHRPDDHGGDRASYDSAPLDDGRTPYDRTSYDSTSYKPEPYAGDAFGPVGPAAQPSPTGAPAHGGYPQAPGIQHGYPQAPYYENFPGQGVNGQQGYAPGPYGQPYAAQKSRVVAGILGILLGALGIHRFYLGFTTIGVIQILMSTVLIFFTFGLSAIAASVWGLVEGIMILVGARQFQRDAHGVPLRD